MTNHSMTYRRRLLHRPIRTKEERAQLTINFSLYFSTIIQSPIANSVSLKSAKHQNANYQSVKRALTNTLTLTH